MKNLLATTIERIVRAEGKKFLDLEFIGQGLDWKSILNPNCVQSLYVHIPFCKVLCPYCSFNRYTYEPSLAKQYFNALKKELALYHSMNFQFSHLYIGGGTPTVNMAALGSLLTEIKQLFPIQQISVETNPSDLTTENVVLLHQWGINRLSVGVQSFKDSLLKDIGRTSHTGQTAIEAIKRAYQAVETLNIDLMYNFPTQTREDLIEDIRLIRSLPVNQVTFYPLMPSPHRKTKLEKEFRTISTEREFSFYQLILDQMLPDYSLSTAWCFSRGERIIDEYIVEDSDYIGIGAGAVSFIQGYFLSNTFSPEKYCKALEQGKTPAVLYKKSTQPEEARYYMLTRLFGMKMSLEEYHRKYGGTLWKELSLLKTFQLIKTKESVLYPTRKGLYYVGLMMKHFFSSLNWLREYCMDHHV